MNRTLEWFLTGGEKLTPRPQRQRRRDSRGDWTRRDELGSHLALLQFAFLGIGVLVVGVDRLGDFCRPNPIGIFDDLTQDRSSESACDCCRK